MGPGIGLKRAGSLLPRVGPLVQPALRCEICKNAVKSGWAGGGAGGAGGCPAMIETTCPGGVAVELFCVAARVERRPVAVDLVVLVLFPRGIVEWYS